MPVAAPFYTASISRQQSVEKRDNPKSSPARQPDARTTLATPKPAVRPFDEAALKPADSEPGRYYFCTETFENCVADGGTFWFGRRKVELAGIDVPRIKQAKCDEERSAGSVAKRRLWEVLNAGAIKVNGNGTSALVTDGQGRAVADILVSEGLAVRGTNSAGRWCGSKAG